MQARFDELNRQWDAQWHPESGPEALTSMLAYFNSDEFAQADRRFQWETLREFDNQAGAFRRRTMYWHEGDDEMTEDVFSNVWDAIEDTPSQAENMKLRSALMNALREHINRKGWTQAEAAQYFGVTQPRVSDLMRGKISLFGLDSLINMAVAAGLNVELSISEAA